MIRRSLLLLALLLPLFADATAQNLSGKVLWIHDGDTIDVERYGTVRLIGIDAPEKSDSDRDRYYLKKGVDRRHLRHIADEGLTFLIRTVKGRQVSLETDHETRDRHGRLLAYVYLPDGTLLNRELLEMGLAAVYRKFDFRLKKQFIDAERRARNEKIGLWEK